MAAHVLPFERPIADLVSRVNELRELANADAAFLPELRRLEDRARKLARELFSDPTPWQKVQLSRHPNRPYTLDYVERLFTDFIEVHGDRRFSDDAALVCGFATFEGRHIAIVGHQKGRGAKDNMRRNFGMPHPEGYRKAERVYSLAERFQLPLFTFIDTPGAYPGIGAEERGQSEAIGACIATMSRMTVPVIATIIGEGGSGGALSLGVADRVHVLEYGVYSVISPEGCASILWKDGSKAEDASARLKITAPDLLRLRVVEEIIDEPAGGAHQSWDGAAENVGSMLKKTLSTLDAMSPEGRRNARYDRFRAIGATQ